MNIDLIAMLSNLSASLVPVQKLISAVGYLMGLCLFFVALSKLRKMSDHHSQQKPFAVLGYFFGAASCMFFPTLLDSLANSVFGVGNILQFSKYDTMNVYRAMRVLITTVGTLFFLRGSYLIMLSSEHEKMGKKGFMFLFAGILAINFDTTVHYINVMSEKFTALTLGGGA